MARQVFGEHGFPLGNGSNGGAGGGSFVTTPIVTGPAEALSGKAVNLSAQALSLINGGAIAWFEVTDSLGQELRAEASANAATFSVGVYGALGDVNTILVRAVDNLGNTSTVAQKIITVTDNSIPNLDAFTHNVPLSIQQQAAVLVRFSGATDPEGDTFSYSVDAENSGLIFGKSTDIAENEEILLTAPPQIMPQRPVSFRVFAIDAKGGKASVSIGTSIIGNRVPGMGGFTHNVPATVTQGSAFSVRFSGAVDPDGDALTYSIDPGDSGCTFSKGQGIAANEDVTMHVPGSVQISLPVSFTVTASDGRGGSATATVSTTILGQDTWTIMSTQNWSPPVSGTYEVDVHGGQGGGCDHTVYGYASGGTGGRAIFSKRLEAGEVFAVTVGGNGGGGRRNNFSSGCKTYGKCYDSSVYAGAGGTTSFGALASATGGSGGVCVVTSEPCLITDETSYSGQMCAFSIAHGSHGNGYGGTTNHTGGSTGPKCIIKYKGA